MTELKLGQLAAGHHTLRLIYQDPGVVFEHIVVTFPGAPSGYPGGLPHNITHVGHLMFASMGCVDDYDEVTITHDEDSWQVRLSREGRLVGVNLIDCCLSAGVMKQAFLRAATGTTSDLEATWTSFNG